jgi:hypothetical protein
MTQALAVCALQLRLLLRQRAILGIVAVWVLQLAILYQVGERGRLVAFQINILVADILVVAMAGGLIADDATLGTFPFLLSHAIDRSAFLIGKLVCVVLLVFVCVECAQAATLFVPSAVVTARGARGASFLQVSTLCAARIVALAAVTAWMSVTLSNRYLVAIGALSYCYGAEVVLHLVLQPESLGLRIVESLLPWRHSFDVAAIGAFSGALEVNRLMVVIAQPLVWTGLFGALSLRILRRRDLRADV